MVDDVSTDKSVDRVLDLVKEYKIENKTKIIINDKNSGYGQSLHKGIVESSGDLVCVVDSDDALASDDALKIERDVHIKYPDAALVYSNYIECNKDLKPKKVYETRALENGETYLKPKTGIRISHFKMIKKKHYDMTSGINPKLKQCVDKELNLRLEEVGRLVYVDADLLYYRRHKDNLSLTIHKKSKKYRDHVVKMRGKIYKDANKRRGIK